MFNLVFVILLLYGLIKFEEGILKRDKEEMWEGVRITILIILIKIALLL